MVIFTKKGNLRKQNEKIWRYLTFLNPIKRTFYMVPSLRGKSKFKMAQVLSIFFLNIMVSTLSLKSSFFHPSYFPHTCRTIQDTISNYLKNFLSLPLPQSPNQEPWKSKSQSIRQWCHMAEWVNKAGGRRGLGLEHLCNNSMHMFTKTKLAFAGRLIPSHTCILSFTLFSSSLDSKNSSFIQRKLVFNSNILEIKF